MSLDLSKLVGVKRLSDKTTAACPQCRAEGLDSSGNHLVLYPDGRFGCCINSDSAHRQAIWRLAGDGKGSNESVPAEEQQPQIEMERTWNPSVLDRLVKDYSYWAGRGISEATIAPFRGGVAVDGQMKDRWVIPIFNDDGLVIGFTGRCLKQMTKEERKKFNRPKWKHISSKSLFVWGDIDEVESTRRAILVESPGDLLALREHGVLDVLCVFGTSISQTVIGALVAASPHQIIVSTNRDPVNERGQTPGQSAAARIKKTLDTFFNSDTVEVRLPPEGVNDWGEATREQIHATFNQSPTPPSENR